MKNIISLALAILLSGCSALSGGQGQLKDPEIEVMSPFEDEVVSSPLHVEGVASGSWFFEGSMPLLLTDIEGNVIVSSFATAQGEWMTAEPVAFEADVEFETDVPDGYLIIRKDNPSGLPENGAEYRMHISF